MFIKSENIGLALSGGGVRAVAFHLGVLKWLAENQSLEKVGYLSSVSGGSLCVSLVLSLSNGRWPTSEQYLESTYPNAKQVLTERSLQLVAFVCLLIRPWSLFSGRAQALAQALGWAWGVKGSFDDLPDRPVWRVNSTCYETGKNWRFSKEKMGDYKFGYSLSPKVGISTAVAASAAFPGLIGPLTFRTLRYNWISKGFDDPDWREATPPFPKVTLWDGGLYENLGLESVYKNGELQHGVEFLIVSDASMVLKAKQRSNLPFWRHLIALRRLIDIATDQIRAVRSRDVVTAFRRSGFGIYVNLGTSPEALRQAVSGNVTKGVSAPSGAVGGSDVRDYPTNLKTLRPCDFEKLTERGRELADLTYRAYMKFGET